MSRGLAKIVLVAIQRVVAGASLRNSYAELREASMGRRGRVQLELVWGSGFILCIVFDDYVDLKSLLFTPCFAWILIKQQLLALANTLISQSLLYLWWNTIALACHLAHMPCIMRWRTWRSRVGRGPLGVRAYIYTHKPTDQ